MTSGWICEYCETHNVAADTRCVVCDQFPSITDPLGAEAPTSTFSQVRPAASPAAPGTAHEGEAARPRGALPWVLVGMGAVALVLLVVIVVLLARPRATTEAVATNTTTAAPASTAAITSTVASTSTSTTVATVVITTPATTLAAPTTAPPVTTGVAPQPSAGGAATPTSGTWTAIFISCDGQAACADATQRFRSFAPAAMLIAPGTYRSLRSYWVVASGSFASGTEAAAFCRSVGRTSRDDCFGRFLSQDPADLAKIAYPD